MVVTIANGYTWCIPGLNVSVLACLGMVNRCGLITIDHVKHKSSVTYLYFDNKVLEHKYADQEWQGNKDLNHPSLLKVRVLLNSSHQSLEIMFQEMWHRLMLPLPLVAVVAGHAAPVDLSVVPEEEAGVLAMVDAITVIETGTGIIFEIVEVISRGRSPAVSHDRPEIIWGKTSVLTRAINVGRHVTGQEGAKIDRRPGIKEYMGFC